MMSQLNFSSIEKERWHGLVMRQKLNTQIQPALQLDITKRGDLRLKLIKLVPSIKSLRSRREA